MELIGEQISPVTSILPAHLNSIETIAAKPDGKELATGSHDHTIKIWDPETGKSNRTLEEHKKGVWTLDYSHDGALLLSGSADGTLLLWDVKDKKPVRTFKGHQNKVYWAKFNQGGNQIASCGENSPTIIWDVMNGSIVKKFCQSEVGYCVEWSKNKQHLVSTHYSGDLNIFDAKNFNLIATTQVDQKQFPRVYGCDIDLSTPDTRIYAACQDKLIRQYTLNGNTLHLTKKIDNYHFDQVKSITINQVKKLMLSTGRDGAVRLWNLNHNHPHLVCNLVGNQDNVGKAVFINNQSTVVAAAGWDQRLNIWRLK